MADKFQFKRGTASGWTTANPVLSAGEPGYELDTKKLKVGDGLTTWSSLGYMYVAVDPIAPPVNGQYLQAADADDEDEAVAFPTAQRPATLWAGTTWEEMWSAVDLTVGTVSVKIWRRTA